MTEKKHILVSFKDIQRIIVATCFLLKNVLFLLAYLSESEWVINSLWCYVQMHAIEWSLY